MSCHIIAITNQKGGVGKTTTTVNLAASLARMGKDVLVVDLDPQGNATTGSGVDKNSLELGVYNILFDESIVENAILHSKGADFDVLGSNRSLVGAEIELVQELAREMKLKIALNTVREKYDYILIDSPPTLTLLTINSLVAADFILVPMICEYYALEGISDLIATINKIKKSKINPSLEIIGLVRTMFDSRSNLSKEVSSQLEKYFQSDLFKTTIPRNIKLAEAPSHGLPVITYDEHSKGAKSYLELARELNEKIKKFG
ncbi:MAG: AAA family ATPase [Neisseriaceae bacterium]|nr:MAG: AAA family ATPase [Neisseriaceae bacterium]